MHEFGLAEGIIEAVQRQAGGRPVVALTVRIGVLLRAHDGPLEQAFGMVAAGTVAAGARLTLVEVPVVHRCAACGHREAADDILPFCPACDSTAIEHTGGGELVLESVEYGGVPLAPSSAAGSG